MNLKYGIKTAAAGVGRHKSRSALTILGIVIGIMSIILVQSVGDGAQELILGQIRGMGANTLFIEPGREPQGPSDFSSILADSLKDREIRVLENKGNVPGLAELTPVVTVPGTASYGGEVANATIFGASELLGTVLNAEPSVGVFITDEDVASRASVAVIGAKVKKELFGESDAVGEKIKIRDKSFRVIGEFAEKGQVAMFDIDNSIIVPHTTAHQYLVGTDHYNFIIAKAVSDAEADNTKDDIETTLRSLHNITDPDKDDFHVTTQADAAEAVGTVTGVLTALLTSIAAISLVVGGIGIMNIMLVSVTERTREIGLRKALGATNNNILLQFMLEAVILTSIGGIIGIMLGSLLSLLASVILSNVLNINWSFAFPLQAALIGFTVAASIGLLFGIYPARQASRKSPMEALRYE